MIVIQTIAEINDYLAQFRPSQSIGFVPTMGALHLGHESLIKRAIAENDIVVVSIFVNPLQFAPTEDLDKYPRQLELDYQKCQSLGVNVVFAPQATELGIKTTQNSQKQEQATVVKPPPAMTAVLCGAFRPGHFTGVATIVTKLLNIIRPQKAYFGRKDAQQLAIIRRLVKDLNIPVQIIGCPIIREKSGLALSSRNQYLTVTEKEKAVILFQSLNAAKLAVSQGARKVSQLREIVKAELATVPDLKIEYISIVEPDTLELLEEINSLGLLAIACYLGSTRLIDNQILAVRKPIIAIDGPAGAGKSTVSKLVAKKLGLLYLDTGAMYRAVTWLIMERGIDLHDENAIADMLKGVDIELIPAKDKTIVKINNQDVTSAIRSPSVTANVSTVAAQPAVRKELVRLQKIYGKQGGIVAEGRDIGTNVFPEAEIKIFLTASVSERAKRRLKDLQAQGYTSVDIKQLEEEIKARDEQDSNRVIAPLQKADDAIEIITDNLTIDEVVNQIVELYRAKFD